MSLGYHLLDVPESLTPSSFLFLTPCSSPPATQPRNPPEPKNKDVQWPQAEDLKQLDEKNRKLVERALEECHNNGIKQWCNTRSEKKDESEGQDIRQWQEMFKIMEKFNSSKEKSIIQLSKETHDLGLEEIHGQIVTNSHDEMTILSITLDPPQRFYIPAHSSFVLDIFPFASSALTTFTLKVGRFDLITLDPPWHNKAVSRLKTKKHLAYNTMKNILTELPPVGNWLVPGGLVAIWCTNSLKMISKVKTTLFKRWGVELVAEWVWLKVTLHGEPVVNMSSSFRKPYEILLLARKPFKGNTLDVPERKVIIAVPGYHSQKPCLKDLFDGIMPNGYRACELYARNLVEGWMSVGDECLKFMREDHWKEIPREQS